jgi:hypothetical protein
MSQRDTRAVFINYRREDTGHYIVPLLKDLRGSVGPDRIFYDRDSLGAGEQWKERLRSEIAQCSLFLAVIGKKWLQARNEGSGQRRLDEEKDWVRTEIELALERTASGLVIVPVLIDGAALPSEEFLPASIKALCNHQTMPFQGTTTADWESGVGTLRAILQKLGLASPGRPVAIDIDSPRIETVHFANEAAQSFTITNVSGATQKVGLTLVVSAVEATESVRLRKAGAILREYALRATLERVGDIDLLAETGVKVVLEPKGSEAFRLALEGAEASVYTCRLVARCRNVETGAEADVESTEFTATFPIRSIEVLRARRRSAPP